MSDPVMPLGLFAYRRLSQLPTAYLRLHVAGRLPAYLRAAIGAELQRRATPAKRGADAARRRAAEPGRRKEPMTRFLDGPAAGCMLALRRAPLFLRVVEARNGRWDALDQLGDEPKAGEAVHVYVKVADRGHVQTPASCWALRRAAGRGSTPRLRAMADLRRGQDAPDRLRALASRRRHHKANEGRC